jgi:alpha-D-ribose 1-methylphosphonate 5-triphosphate synthase subunit PhnH
MKLDFIHDIQSAYRKVVDSMSKPGFITNLKDEADKVDLEAGCFSSTLVLAMMLLDTEVTFKVISNREEEITRWMNQLTYSKTDEVEKADFVFVLQDVSQSMFEQTFKQAKIGSLLDPHESATVIIETDEIRNGNQYVLTGPGIEGENYAEISIKGNWVEIREQKNAEYPMGVDLIFVDKSHNLLCLPRTTQISIEGGSLDGVCGS